MEADQLLWKAAATLHIGGKETLNNPPVFACADQIHEPFRLQSHAFQFRDEEKHFLWGRVSTSGAQFDGDRTDVHDVLSLIWGAVLRAYGLSSAWLIDESHGIVPGEMGARHLVLQQCPWNLADHDGFEPARKAMNAWSAFAFHQLNDVFKWDRGGRSARPDRTIVHDKEIPGWVDPIIKYLRTPEDFAISRRTFPLWLYLSSPKRGVTVIRMPRIRVSFLKDVLMPFAPNTTRGEKALVMFANGIPNAVSFALLKKARKLLSLTGDECNGSIVLPLDSHCLFIGDKTIVALRGECGRKVFERERGFLIKRRKSEDRVFFAYSVIKWQKPISERVFEGLCLDLVKREPGVIRAKPVGSVNDRDDGRDIIIDQRVPNRHTDFTEKTSVSNSNKGQFGSGGTKIVRLIAQVKTRSRTIGKHDVRDIRDTLERHHANGFLLIAYPRISAPLVDHLEDLRKRTELRTEWWESPDIEERLRRHPDLAKRYPKLMTLQPTV